MPNQLPFGYMNSFNNNEPFYQIQNLELKIKIIEEKVKQLEDKVNNYNKNSYSYDSDISML